MQNRSLVDVEKAGLFPCMHILKPSEDEVKVIPQTDWYAMLNDFVPHFKLTTWA